MAVITSYGRETARVTADSLASDERTCSLVNDNETSYRREKLIKPLPQSRGTVCHTS